MQLIDRIEEAKELLADIRSQGRIFRADVTKRTTGEDRRFVAIPHEDALNDYDQERDLMTVHDTVAGGVRAINIPGLKELRANGETYKFDFE